MSVRAPTRRLPEDEGRLAAFREALTRHEGEAVDAVERARESLAKRDLLLLENPGVPLRPLFIPRSRLQAICGALHQNMLALGRKLDALLDDPAALEEALPLPREWWDALDARASLRHPDFGLVLRPDGFLYDDAFLLTEPNMGNGYLISCTYPDAVHEVFASSPVFASLGWDPHALVQRPLMHIRKMLRRKVPSTTTRPRIALLWHHGEHEIIREWNERTQGILRYVPEILRQDGWDVVFAHEDELSVDDEGNARLKGDQRVDVVFQIPIGTFFLYEPARLSTDLAHLRGPSVGNAPLLQPLVHVGIDKGTMPLMGTQDCWPTTTPDGFRVDLVPTHYPTPERAAEYRMRKDAWVLKRSFEGKDTHVGCATHGRVWNRTLQTALSTAEYVMQPYVPMSVADIPVVMDGRVEWVESSVELSLLIIDGAFAGGFARFLPAADGVVLSPPPPGMGFTLVMDV
ncbi:MAG: hypothetical protein AB2A00_06825 [Myxococcota bacterium]